MSQKPTGTESLPLLRHDPLLKAQEAASELNIGRSTFWREVKSGGLPAPYYVCPKMPRWRLSELRAAIAARPRSGGGDARRWRGEEAVASARGAKQGCA